MASNKYVDGINEERFELFLKDLRSGDYHQGRSALHYRDINLDGKVVDKFCCLGVACVRPAFDGAITVKYPEGDYATVRYDGYNTVDLPLKVADYLGIPQANRVSVSDGSCDVAFLRMGYDESPDNRGFTAIGLNDLKGKNFEEIADAFEQEFIREV